MEQTEIKLTFLGSGDAFGSGGRLQPCVHISQGQSCFLIDCGSSALISMKRHEIDPSNVEAVLVSHLHGDHFSGIPFMLRETQILSRRTSPLVIAGPPGLEDCIRTCMRIFFPGSWSQDLSFDLHFLEMEASRHYTFGDMSATLFPAVHTPATNPHSIRVQMGSKSIAYTGDTEWNSNLIEACRTTELSICECFKFEGPLKNHLDYKTLRMNHQLLETHRIVLTHMSDDMLKRIHEIEFECSYDGMSLTI